jgi:TonB family protein
MAPVTAKKASRASDLSRGKVILRTTIILSLVLHACLLLAIQRAFPISWVLKPLKTYRVELIRPPVDPSEQARAGEADLAKIKPEEKTPPEETEETISLDTKDERYSSYAALIKGALAKHWDYPLQARNNLIEGRLLVLFSLARSGHLKEIKVLTPSGFNILDSEAIRAIRSAAPFPPFPESVKVTKLNVMANFDYRLTTSSAR